MLCVALLIGSAIAAEEPAPKPTEPKTPPKAQEQKSTPESTPSEQKKEEPKAQTPAPKQEKAAEAPPSKPPESAILPIKLALMADYRVFPYDINVDMKGDAAELSGKVSSEAEKTAAAEIAQGIEGVKSVINNIELSKDLNHTLTKKKDDIITQYVKDRFGKSKTLELSHFDIRTEDGIVSLGGKTKFLVIVLEAAEAARQVPGVKAVKTDAIRLEGAD
jgi:osmotically-inducible protein OsmY